MSNLFSTRSIWIPVKVTVLLVAQQPMQAGTSQHIRIIHRLAINPDGLIYQPYAMAVVGIPVHMPGIQRLDRNTRKLMPAVDGHPVRFFVPQYLPRYHHVLFDTCDQPFSSFSLSFHDQMMLPHGDTTVPKGIHGYRLQLYLCRYVYIIDHFTGWQEAPQAVRNFLRRNRRKGHPRPIVICADAEVIRGNIVPGVDLFASGRISDTGVDPDESLQEFGHIPRQDQPDRQGITFFPMPGSHRLEKIGTPCCRPIGLMDRNEFMGRTSYTDTYQRTGKYGGNPSPPADTNINSHFPKISILCLSAFCFHPSTTSQSGIYHRHP